MNKHQKHAKLVRPILGKFHRSELAILGTTCSNIRDLSNHVIQELYAKYQIAYVDADHKAPQVDEDSALTKGATMEFTDKITYRSLNCKQTLNQFQFHSTFNNHDLVLVNGNHFTAESQIVVIDSVKPLDQKLEKLTNIQLILLADEIDTIPRYITQHLPIGSAVPVLKLGDILSIAKFIDKYLTLRLPQLNGLVLAGGQSQRMQTDKGSLEYFGKSQRLHVHQLLRGYCKDVYISYANAQAVNQDEQLPVVLDTFTGLGPFGGILSAFQTNPNTAWFTLACDLPYLSAETLAFLVEHRNPSKLATCFMDNENRFPEPLITVWEPKAYPVMLQFLSQGYSCPRKVLINSDVELLQAPVVKDLQNVNYPEEQQAAMAHLHKSIS
ncbi:NTP transferase domain-containing protein [Mucilaginibacter terrae]|uniref:NTP transferase domain-containing protein n=1 Tax=Mucilaginibacter terrae TaxID=1955052 RepID=UPI0036432E90